MELPPLNQLPLILAGPILRKVGGTLHPATPPTLTSVAVWVALQKAGNITYKISLTVMDAKTGAARLTDAPEVNAIQVGDKLVVALATAKANSSSDELEPNTLYTYTLTISGSDGSTKKLTDPGVYTKPGQAFGEELLSYPSLSGVVHASVAGLPTFVIPGTTPDKLRIVHGSCRKPHADSLDALALLDKFIGDHAENAEEGAEKRRERPQQLLLTGDQIYADDVADELMAIILETAPTLIGSEELPGVNEAEELGVGRREAFMRDRCGFTAKGVQSNHLVRFGEYMCMYLLAYSDQLWPAFSDVMDRFRELFPSEPPQFAGLGSPDPLDYPHFKAFKRQRLALLHFRKDLPRVRRAMANVATYMVIDDHDVTDDWYLNREWLNRSVLKSELPFSRRVVLDGLLAGLMFQAQGNRPGEYSDQFAAFSAWRQNGFPADGTTDLAVRLGIPSPGGAFPRDAEFPRVKDAQRPTPRWDFQIAWDCHEIIGLDTRSHRIYPTSGGSTPPGMLSKDDLGVQVSEAAPTWRDTAVGGVTLVIVPGPMVGLSFIEGKQIKAAKKFEGTIEHDAEAPRLDAVSFDQLIFKLAARDKRRSRVVFLSGDVHYALAGRLEYWSEKQLEADRGKAAKTRAVFAQLVGSSLHNQGLIEKLLGSLALHFGGFRLSRRSILRFGWVTELDQGKSLTVGNAEWSLEDQVLREADWQVRVDRDKLASTDLAKEIDSYDAVTATVTPDWRNRLSLIVPGSKPVTVDRVDNRPDEPLDVAVAFILMLFQYVLRYVSLKSGGKEIVGVNNIATLELHWEAGDDKRVKQTLHWYRKGFDRLYQAHDDGTENTFLETTVAEVPLGIDEEPPPLGRIEL